MIGVIIGIGIWPQFFGVFGSLRCTLLRAGGSFRGRQAIERSFTKRNWRHVVMYAIDPTQCLVTSVMWDLHVLISPVY